MSEDVTVETDGRSTETVTNATGAIGRADSGSDSVGGWLLAERRVGGNTISSRSTRRNVQRSENNIVGGLKRAQCTSGNRSSARTIIAYALLVPCGISEN